MQSTGRRFPLPLKGDLVILGWKTKYKVSLVLRRSDGKILIAPEGQTRELSEKFNLDECDELASTN